MTNLVIYLERASLVPRLLGPGRFLRRGAVRGLLVLAAIWAVGAALLLAPSAARAADCSLPDLSYNGACGPQFELPAWGDGAGWKDPSKYTTIRLADLTGSGVDELIARNDSGIEIWRFDTTLGQWRPAVDRNGNAQVLPDFRSPKPSESGSAWNQPAYYTTIQTADVDGDGAAEIVARFPTGVRVYKYKPPAGTKNIDGGTWSLLSQDGPFRDEDVNGNPAVYLSIHVIGASDGSPARLIGQTRYWGGIVPFNWTGSGWVLDSAVPLKQYVEDPKYYLDTRVATLPSGTASVRAVVQRTSNGIYSQYRGSGGWQPLDKPPAVLTDQPKDRDCPFSPSSDCLGDSPAYYETLRFANIDGGTGDEMLARTSDGLFAYKLGTDGKWQRLPTLTDLKGSAADLKDTPGRWASIRTGDVLGNRRQQVLALDGSGLQAWSYDPTAQAWSKLSAQVPLKLGGRSWDSDASYYSTIQVGDVVGDGRDAVIARGPYGIRTWFYCAAGDTRTRPCGKLGGKSGWTSWLPQDTGSYPEFRSTPASYRGTPRLYWTSLAGAIGSANLDGTIVNQRLLSTSDFPVGTAVDAQHIYWINAASRAIGRANLDGTGVNQNFITDNEQPAALSVDGQHIYWTNTRSIGRANLDGTGVNQNFITGAGDLGGVAIDGQHIYWTDATAGTIGRANLDGTGVNQSFITGAGRPGDIAVDRFSGHIYWANASSHTIERANLEGTGVDHSLITVSGKLIDLAVDPVGQHIYWTDHAAGTIGRANLDGTEVNNRLITDVNLPTGLAVSVPADCVACGRGAAFAALNREAAKAGYISGGSVRDAWTAANKPDDTALQALQNGLTLLGNCSGQTPGNPPHYATCTPPPASTAFSADDWTTVINEVLSEIYSARQVSTFFSNLNDLRRDTFLAQGAELPAIASSLKELAGAADNKTEIDPKEIWRVSLSIAGSIFEEVPGLGAALHTASELVGLLTSPSPDLTTPFDGTYIDLQQKFAAAVTEADKTLAVQNADVRQNYGLLTLITQLTAPTGAWRTIDYNGLKSSMNEGFALWAYKQLLPTLYYRYVVTNCKGEPETPLSGNTDCFFASSKAVVGAAPNFTTLETPPGGDLNDGWPCWQNFWGGFNVCKYDRPITGDLADRIWGQQSDTCKYTGDPGSIWTFGCNLGVSPDSSTDGVLGPINGWNFATCTANPVLYGRPIDIEKQCSIPAAATTGSKGSLRVSAAVGLPSGFRVRSATLLPAQLLSEPGHKQSLVRTASGQASGPIHLALRVVAGKQNRTSRTTRLASSPGHPPAQLTLTAARGRTSLRLTVSRINVAVPTACEQLDASDSLARPPVVLRTSLRLSNGHSTRTISLPIDWQCKRNRADVVTQLRSVTPARLPRRSGLAVRLLGSATVIPGSTYEYSLRISNTRRGPRQRASSSLWHLFAQATLTPARGQKPTRLSIGVRPITRRITELRRRRSRTLRLPIDIPFALKRSAVRRVCVTVLVTADAARPGIARRCARLIRLATTPSPTAGLG